MQHSAHQTNINSWYWCSTTVLWRIQAVFWGGEDSLANIHKYTISIHTHNHLTAFVRDNPGRPVPEETLTQSCPTWSSDILYHLHLQWSMASSVHFTCLTILSDNLSPGPLWSSSWFGLWTSYSIHFFTQSSSSFCSTCPYQCSLFCCKTNAMSYLVSLSAPYLGVCLLA